MPKWQHDLNHTVYIVYINQTRLFQKKTELQRKHSMIISDLSHLEVADQSPSLVGAGYSYSSYSKYKSNSSYLNQYASSKATAKSVFGPATAVAISTNVATVTQLNF
ncbi:hypothetical protein [Trichocoleus sp. DQ-U1]|uniref:hypothetical protein n=1 Tax=Trichocoleus sp. DQ-U1 TaxID=2933926 RepID=UPI00329A6A61